MDMAYSALPHYSRPSDAQPHVARIEDALKTWDRRRGTERPFDPRVVSQSASRWSALLRAIERMWHLGLDHTCATVLDVGAGSGDGLRPFLEAGFRLDQLTGIDLYADRIQTAAKILPGLRIMQGDATNMRAVFGDASFDVVCEQFCFCHIPDHDTKRRIALEMLRVTKPGGFLVVHDWRMTVARRKIFGPSQEFIRAMFTGADHVAVLPSQLWPQLGRLLSNYAPAFYTLGHLIPGAVGSRLTVLRKQ